MKTILRAVACVATLAAAMLAPGALSPVRAQAPTADQIARYETLMAVNGATDATRAHQSESIGRIQDAVHVDRPGFFFNLDNEDAIWDVLDRTIIPVIGRMKAELVQSQAGSLSQAEIAVLVAVHTDMMAAFYARTAATPETYIIDKAVERAVADLGRALASGEPVAASDALPFAEPTHHAPEELAAIRRLIEIEGSAARWREAAAVVHLDRVMKALGEAVDLDSLIPAQEFALAADLETVKANIAGSVIKYKVFLVASSTDIAIVEAIAAAYDTPVQRKSSAARISEQAVLARVALDLPEAEAAAIAALRAP